MRPQRFRDTGTEPVRLNQDGNQLVQLILPGSFRQVMQSVGAPLAGAHFQVYQPEFLADFLVRFLQFPRDADKGLIQP